MAVSFELRGESAEEQPALAVRKPRIILRVTLSILLFVVGTSCGWYFHGSRETEKIKEVLVTPNVVVELQVGIEDVIELYPEGADALREQKKNIMNYMLNMTDPPEDSPLRERMLISSSEPDLPTRRLDLQILKKDGTPSADAAVCYGLIAGFVQEFMNFIAGFARLTIPHGDKFKDFMIRWIQSRYTPLQFGKAVSAFVYSEETSEKIKLLWTLFISSKKKKGGLMKGLFDWLAKEFDAWASTKAIIKLAAQVAIWYEGGPLLFISDMTFHAQNFQKILAAGRNVVSKCSTFFDANGGRRLLT